MGDSLHKTLEGFYEDGGFVASSGTFAIVHNRDVHSLARLSRRAFANRVKSVQAIRCNAFGQPFSWYPTSLFNVETNRSIHKAVRDGDFSGLHDIEIATSDYSDRLQKELDSGKWLFVSKRNLSLKKGDIAEHFVMFSLIVPVPLARLLSGATIDVVERMIVVYLSLLWMSGSDDDERIAMSEQVYPSFLEKAIELSRPYGDRSRQDMSVDFCDELCLKYAGTHAPGIFFDNSDNQRLCLGDSPEWCMNSFSCRVGTTYFTTRDWLSIVIGDDDDDLDRCESVEEMWRLWLESFLCGSPCASNASSPGFIYLIRNSSTGRVKIGWTKSDPRSRLNNLQTGCDSALELIGSFPASSIATEALLHERYASHRISGEWFSLSDYEISRMLDVEWRRQEGIH